MLTIGKPLTCFITAHLEKAGIAPDMASRWMRQHLELLKKYHERNGMFFSCIWVLENSGKNGVHAHVLIHRPAVLPMHPMTYRARVQRMFKLPNRKGMLKVEKFYGWQSYAENLEQVENYILKGIRPEVASRFNVKPFPQGVIIGKRIGWSRKAPGA